MLFPSKSKAEAVYFLNKFIDDIGIPIDMRFDHAAEFLEAGNEFTKIINNHSINWKVTEPYSHWKNRAYNGINIIKLRWKSTM